MEGSLNPGVQLRKELPQWHLALFSSSVTAGIVTAVDLAGYRNRPIFIAGALHVPPPAESLRDCMPLLMELLEAEESGAVRAVLGHFVFVFIHPYIDGNGRLGRFIMNYMLTTAGYVWTIVPVQQRAEYMAALEQASSDRNIRPLAQMLARLVTEQTASTVASRFSAHRFCLAGLIHSVRQARHLDQWTIGATDVIPVACALTKTSSKAQNISHCLVARMTLFS